MRPRFSYKKSYLRSTQQTFNYSTPVIEALERSSENGLSSQKRHDKVAIVDDVLESLLTLKIFHTLF